MRIYQASTELHEFGVHSVVYTSSITLIVRTCTLQCTLLVEVIERYIISTVGTTTAEGYVMVLSGTSLEYLVKPVCIGCILEMIFAILTKFITTCESCIRVGASLTEIVAILVGIHHIIYITRNLVNTEVTRVVYLQRLVFLTILGSDDNDTISSTRTVDGTRRSILQDLDGLDIIRREVTDSGTHWHTINDIKRSCATERTDTTNSHTRICTRLTV